MISSYRPWPRQHVLVSHATVQLVKPCNRLALGRLKLIIQVWTISICSIYWTLISAVIRVVIHEFISKIYETICTCFWPPHARDITINRQDLRGWVILTSPWRTTIDEILPRQYPCLRAFELWRERGIRRTRRRSDRNKGTREFTQVRPPGG
jgi:hypothetical protein